MPELPEVERAARIARGAAVGRTITSVETLHAAHRRQLPADAVAQLTGERVTGVERRGKHQLLRLTSGRALHVHFRMTGDWVVVGSGVAQSPALHPRLVLAFDDGSRLVLDDSRALSVVSLCEAGVDPCAGLGPEATAASFDAAHLQTALARRRVSIKVALLDQGLVAGIGNIYASEALWYARVSPRLASTRLTRVRIARVVAGVKRALGRAMAHSDRYYGSGASDPRRFNVYDREGKPCRRCGSGIVRIVQGGRSTFYCTACVE